MASATKIAVLGADEPLGEAVIRHIEERDLDVAEIIPVSLDESDRCATVAGTEVPLQRAADFDWSGVAVLISASRAPAADRQAERARQAGCAVIAVGSETINAAAVAIARVAGPIARQAGLGALDAVVTVPVCMAGAGGVEELAGQTRALFAMEDVEADAFPLQIAFNLIPQVGATLPDGGTAYEAEIVRAVRALLAMPDLPLSVTALWSPVFYGGSIILHGEAAKALTTERLDTLLADRPGLVHMDVQVPGGVPSPATDAQDSEDVFVGRLRVVASHPRRFAVWLVMDMSRLEAAQIVDRLEKAVARPAPSVLT